MADDKSKYQCLVDAVANSGLKLSPIKSGSEVVETTGAFILGWKYVDDVAFRYDTPDGKLENLSAMIFDTASEGDVAGKSGFFVGHDQESAAGSLADPKSGIETSENQKPIPGTVKNTVDKIFRCRDPKVS